MGTERKNIKVHSSQSNFTVGPIHPKLYLYCLLYKHKQHYWFPFSSQTLSGSLGISSGNFPGACSFLQHSGYNHTNCFSTIPVSDFDWQSAAVMVICWQCCLCMYGLHVCFGVAVFSLKLKIESYTINNVITLHYLEVMVIEAHKPPPPCRLNTVNR